MRGCSTRRSADCRATSRTRSLRKTSSGCTGRRCTSRSKRCQRSCSVRSTRDAPHVGAPHFVRDFDAPVPARYDAGRISQDEGAGMLTEYIQAAMRRATYEILPEDKTYYGEIPGFQGVWANADTL